LINDSDKKWIIKALQHFGIKRIGIAQSESRAKWPDIWCEMGGKYPVITVTREWAKQGLHERRKRLTHEMLHLCGMQHDESLGYSTYPQRDKFSMRYYNSFLRSLK
jgi:hypothetical protein